mgnify:FL=1
MNFFNKFFTGKMRRRKGLIGLCGQYSFQLNVNLAKIGGYVNQIKCMQHINIE